MRRGLSRSALLGVILACAVTRAAWAQNPLVQTPISCGTGITTCVLGSSPQNGNTVVVQITKAANLASVTVKDSNNVALTQEALNCQSTSECAATYDYCVSGSPTSTFTASLSFQQGQIYELVGCLTATALYTGAAAASGTLTATQAGVLVNNVQICLAGASSFSGTPVITMSNGTYTQVVASRGGYAIATATASSTCTMTPGTSQTNPAITYADYMPVNANPVSPSGGVYPGGGQWPPYTTGALFKRWLRV